MPNFYSLLRSCLFLVALTATGILTAQRQVSPVAFVDIGAANTQHMGVLPIWDVSIPATFVQNAFRNNLSDVFDPTEYINLGGAEGRGFVPVTNGVNWVIMRVQSGTITYYWNGKRRGEGVAVPAWATGRTKMGVHVIGIDYEVGETYPTGLGGGTVTTPTPSTITDWFARPLT